ncbi:MAG: hypothetical protein JWQ02_1121 [Capsulimonas sp.]|nr:hypothetical protein [Capsulimonas sp.]
MKALIWKEWRETRLIPAAITILFLVTNLLWTLIDIRVRALYGPASGSYTGNTTLISAGIAVLLGGVLSASGAFSGEIGAGSLSFLTMLPISRGCIWVSKVIAGLLSVFLSCLGVGAAGAVIFAGHVGLLKDAATYAPAAVNDYLFALQDPHIIIFPMGIVLLAAIGCFGVSLMVSLLVDRTLISSVISIIACVGIPFLVVCAMSAAPLLFSGSTGFAGQAGLTVLGLVIPVFYAASYYIFANGETLRSSKRYFLMGQALACWMALNIVIFAGCYALRNIV